jgi:Ca-activated chloride channel homolog
MMNITFAYPGVLYLLWGVPAWCFLLLHLRKQRQRKCMQFTGATLAPRLLPETNRHIASLQIACATLALALLLVAAAGPRSRNRREQEVTMRGRDLVLLIDVSRSMLANDVHPSRLVRAKADMLDILDELRPGDRLAIVAFRNRATRITPFTTDQRFLRQAIAGLSIHSAPAGETDLASGIRMALQIFDDDSPAHKAAILISDGEDLTSDAVRAAQQAAQRRIPFFTVGIGSRAGSTIPDAGSQRGLLLHDGEPVITRLEDEPLVTLARLTGGAYIPVETAGVGAVTLGQRIREHLRAVEVQTFTTIEAFEHTELFAHFLLPGILLLLFAGLLSQGQYRLTVRRTMIMLFLLTAIPPPGSSAAESATVRAKSHRALARQAQTLQRDGAFADAAALYLEAAGQADLPASARDRYRYNAAIASLLAGDHAQARDLLATLPPIHQAQLANALARFKQGEQTDDGSAEGYRKRLAEWQDAARLLQQYWQQSGAENAAQDLQTLDGILPSAKREARFAEVLERHAEAQPQQLAQDMLQQQRASISELEQTQMPPPGPERIRFFEEQARSRRELADKYLALAHQAGNAGMPPEQLQQLLREMASLEQQADALSDLTKPATEQPVEMGHPLYDTWRQVASPESLLGESIRQQAWLDDIASGQPGSRPPIPLANLQAEAGALTDLFAERFQPPEDTPQETLEKINELTGNTARLQRLAAEMLALNDQEGAKEVQREALEALRHLAKILPQPPPSQSEQQKQDQEQNQDQTQQQEQQQDNQDPSEGSDETQVPQQPEQPQDEEQKDTEEPKTGDEKDTFDLDGLIEQVEQRAQDYRDRIQERQERLQRQRGARDW